MEIEESQVNKSQKADKSKILNLLNKFRNKKGQSYKRDIEENQTYHNSYILPQKKNYEIQYSHLYYLRITEMGAILKDQMVEQHPNIPSLDSIIQLEHSKQQIIIGTIYKDMKLKPNIVKQIDENVYESQQNFVSDTDFVHIEDSYGKVKLLLTENSFYKDLQGQQQQIKIQQLITGIVCAILGVLDKDTGVFEVQQMIFQDLPEQDNSKFKIPKPLLENQNHNFNNLSHYLEQNNTDNFIMITSGLNLYQDEESYNLLLLKNFLFGNDQSEQMKNFSKRIQKLIIAGNIVQAPSDQEEILEGPYRVDEKFENLYNVISKTMKHFDSFLNELCNYIPVDLMPGPQDPSNKLYPQQPINRCYFQQTFKNATLKGISNPSAQTFSNINILGTSGQNVQDIKRFTNFDNNDLQIIENNIMWGHIAPTAPDTLNCYPFSKENDCFILKNLPHLYFVGNCNEFGTKMIYDQKQNKYCRIISVPQFSKSNSVVLVNMKNLDTFEMQFNKQ